MTPAEFTTLLFDRNPNAHPADVDSIQDWDLPDDVLDLLSRVIPDVGEGNDEYVTAKNHKDMTEHAEEQEEKACDAERALEGFREAVEDVVKDSSVEGDAWRGMLEDLLKPPEAK